MKRALHVVSLVLVLAAVSSRPAEANLWDWLDQLSGPGPFASRGNIAFTLQCEPAPGTRTRDDNWLNILRPDERGQCWYFDQRVFRSEADDRFGPVTASISEVGSSYQLVGSLEVGAGAGLARFSSEGASATRLTLTFPRLVFKPLRLIPQLDERRWPSFFQVYYRETLIVGPLRHDDFDFEEGVTFSVDHDRVKSMGFIIDVTAFLPKVW
jgi:hypothetical protein